jgi:hypothetical protein
MQWVSQAHSRIQGAIGQVSEYFWFGFTLQGVQSQEIGEDGSSELSAVPKLYVACALFCYYTEGHWLEFLLGNIPSAGGKHTSAPK